MVAGFIAAFGISPALQASEGTTAATSTESLLLAGMEPEPRTQSLLLESMEPAAVLEEADRVQVVHDQLLIKFDPGTGQSTINGVLARAGVTPEDIVDPIDVRVVEVEPGQREEVLAALKASPAVEYAERDLAMTALGRVPNDPGWSRQWGPQKIRAPRAWDTTVGSRSIVIAVLDTGVYAKHPDLSGALVPGYDLVGNDSNPNDDHGHGTAVAGVIAARTNNKAGQAGMCWKCRIMPIKVLDKTGSSDTSTIAKGIVWAADNGARIINLSLGGPGTSHALTDAMVYAAGKGTLIFAAAGNGGSTTKVFPAAYPQALAVAGTQASDRPYTWSNHGPWVQIAAPGCNVAPAVGGGYVDFCGTSSATPVVAGLAGLALSVRPRSSATAVYNAIKSSARNIGNSVLFGRVTAAGTLFALGGG